MAEKVTAGEYPPKALQMMKRSHQMLRQRLWPSDPRPLRDIPTKKEHVARENSPQNFGAFMVRAVPCLCATALLLLLGGSQHTHRQSPSTSRPASCSAPS